MIVLISILMSILILSLIFLAFIVIYPSKWAEIVDKENSFWVKKGLLKESTAKRMSNFEKGKYLKIITLFAILISLLDIWLINIWFIK